MRLESKERIDLVRSSLKAMLENERNLTPFHKQMLQSCERALLDVQDVEGIPRNVSHGPTKKKKGWGNHATV